MPQYNGLGSPVKERMVRFLSRPKHFLPQHFLSRIAGAAANSTLFGRALIWLVRTGYGIGLEEAREPDPRAYQTLNAFFTRALRQGARPMPEAPDAIACPADGSLMSFGRLTGEQLIEAKGQEYSIRRLLGDEASAARLRDGFHACVYLSPPDYHRVHIPFGGRLFSWTSIPGNLFSVNPATAARISDLHCRNERLICRFETSHGLLAVVFIGARMVGSIETTFNPPPTPYGDVQTGETGGPDYDRGEELGRFKFGSTVVICFEAENFDFRPELEAGMRIRVGDALGEFVAPRHDSSANRGAK